MPACKSCGEEVKFAYGGRCKRCLDLWKRANSGDEEASEELAALSPEHNANREALLAKAEELAKVFATTEMSVPGVVERLGLVSGQCALGMNIFRDLTAEIRDVVGGRSGAYQRAIKEATDMCILEMRREAHELGADAVIAVDLDFNEITGGGGLFDGKGMMLAVATGTAVKLSASETTASQA